MFTSLFFFFNLNQECECRVNRGGQYMYHWQTLLDIFFSLILLLLLLLLNSLFTIYPVCTFYLLCSTMPFLFSVNKISISIQCIHSTEYALAKETSPPLYLRLTMFLFSPAASEQELQGPDLPGLPEDITTIMPVTDCVPVFSSHQWASTARTWSSRPSRSWTRLGMVSSQWRTCRGCTMSRSIPSTSMGSGPRSGAWGSSSTPLTARTRMAR